MLRIRSHALLTLALLGAASAGSGEVAPVRSPSGVLERRVLAMGTTFSLRLEGPEHLLEGASEGALAEVVRIEGALSTWREDSAFAALNAAGGREVRLDREWLDLLAAALRQTERTDGCFDPVLMSLLRAWKVREGTRFPGAAALRRARAAAGVRLLSLDAAAGTARLLHPEAGVEEGAFGKGYALDCALFKLREAGVPSGLLDFGGQLLAFGPASPVSLADPKDRARPRLSLMLKEASLSTSGASERGLHILDPRTGRPRTAWGSASALAPTGFEADCLSTALFVMGPVAGLRWASAHGVAACFLLNDGRIRMSPAFKALAPTIL